MPSGSAVPRSPTSIGAGDRVRMSMRHLKLAGHSFSECLDDNLSRHDKGGIASAYSAASICD